MQIRTSRTINPTIVMWCSRRKNRESFREVSPGPLESEGVCSEPGDWGAFINSDRRLAVRGIADVGIHLSLVQQQHMNLAGVLHRNLHTELHLAERIEHAKFETGITDDTERDLVLAGSGSEVQQN